MNTMEGPESFPEEPLPERLQRIRRMWLRKAMAYIYQKFFHDETIDVYSTRNDTTLLVTVVSLTLVIALLVGLKFHSYINYKRAIFKQIQVVNAKWQSMLVSVDILRKIADVHSSIVTSQMQIDQIKLKQSQSCENLASERDQLQVLGNVKSSVEVRKSLGKDRRTRKPMLLKKSKYVKKISKASNAHSNKTGNHSEPVCNKETGDKVPDTWKSKNSYTVNWAQSNLTLLPIGGGKLDVKNALEKLSSSEVKLEELHSRASKLNMPESESSSDFSQSLDLSCSEDTFNPLAFNPEHVASAIYDDECTNQITKLLENWEQDSGTVSLGKHDEISNLINAMMGRIFDELNNIREDLAQF